MSRLYVSGRDLNFISDISKEIVKDVIGQQIILYPISELKTLTHDVYGEAVKKIFDKPIALDAIVDAQLEIENQTTGFGFDKKYKVELFLHSRDLIHKGINVNVGDFFKYSNVFFEITQVQSLTKVFGIPEQSNGIKVTATNARQGQIDELMRGPTDIKYADEDAVQDTFVQQHGDEDDDKRDLVDNGVIERIDNAREVSPKGGQFDNSNNGSSFYGDD